MLSDRDYTKAPFRQAPRRRANDTVLKPLIIINGVVFLLQGMSNGALTSYLSLRWDAVSQGQIWRLGSYMFAHGGLWHILMNMWGLWLFGGIIERQLGGKRLLNLYLISGLVGGLIWLLFNHGPQQIGELKTLQGVIPIFDYPSSIGASGSVFGFLLVAAMLQPNQMLMLLFPPIPIKLKTFALFYGLLEAYNTVFHGAQSNIAHLAHLGGMLGGYLYLRWVFRGRWSVVSTATGSGVWHMPGNRKKTAPKWNLFNQRKKPSPPPPPMDYSAKGDPMKEIDAILDKIGRQGLDSLTEYERGVLQHVREKLKKKHR
ncbi:MAG: rhomboid family intramembrane serine protease [Lentisphaeria bacterium]|nr:rhomboid family intramembrane serine protease [Lentisphaeria bacterium]